MALEVGIESMRTRYIKMQCKIMIQKESFRKNNTQERIQKEEYKKNDTKI